MRLHLHLRAPDLNQAKQFYSALFGAPGIETSSYLRWEPDNVAITLAITRGEGGVDHIGLKGEKADIDPRIAALAAAGFGAIVQEGAECCYSRADKAWVTDPSGVHVEIYSGTVPIEVFGTDLKPSAMSAGSSCCSPSEQASGCCAKPAVLPDAIAALLR